MVYILPARHMGDENNYGVDTKLRESKREHLHVYTKSVAEFGKSLTERE